MSKVGLLPVLWAFSSYVAWGGLCTTGTLEDYMNLGATGCTQGAFTFQDFAVVPGITGALVISPSAVTVIPGGSAQLEFVLEQSAAAGELYQSIFRFTAVGSLSPAELRLNDPSAAVDGAVTGIIDVCADGFFAGDSPTLCASTAQSAVAAHIDGFSEPVTSVLLPPSSFFDVFIDLTVDGGLDGAASLRSSTLTLGEGGEIPEPSTSLLLAAGLSVVSILRRRRRAK